MITIDSECWSSARRFANQPELAWPRLGFGFSSDLDENLTQDGLWTYEWDADEVRSTEMAKPRRGEERRVPFVQGDQQNRLIAMESRTDLPATVTRQRLEFAYDSRSRRIEKTVKEYDSGGSTWTTTAQIEFLYDGWNLLAEYDALNSDVLIRSHALGVDLSGTLQGVGGVGGLLWSSQASNAFAPGFDGNGNIIAWIDLGDGSLVGTAEYGAFGEKLTLSGISAQLPFGFSTKYEDSETGLFYYGFRYYSPNHGRWLSIDPIAEIGGLNIQAFVDNDPLNYFDDLGKSKNSNTGPVPPDQRSPNSYPRPPTPSPTTPPSLTSGSGNANKTGGAVVNAVSAIASGGQTLALAGHQNLGLKQCQAQQARKNDGCHCCHYWVDELTTYSFNLPTTSRFINSGGSVYKGNCNEVRQQVQGTTFLKPGVQHKNQTLTTLDFYAPW